jgi:hypothetical protein
VVARPTDLISYRDDTCYQLKALIEFPSIEVP